MIVFIYGSDSYRLRQAREDIISRYKAKYSSGINLFSLDLSVAENTESLETSLKTSSFFNEHKLIVCRNVFGNKQSAEDFLKLIKENKAEKATDITLVVAENLGEKELTTKHKELFKLLSDKDNVVKVIEPLSEARLTEWVKNEFKIRNCSIKEPAIKNLTDATGSDSWALTNEIEKLSAFKNGEEVTASDIAEMTSNETELSIFDLVDAIGSQNKPKALELLYRELKSGREPYYILTMIVYQFRNLLMVEGLSSQGLAQTEIAKKAGLHPFVVKKAMSCVSKFKPEDLKLKYKTLLDIDTNSKQGIVNLSDSLYKFVTA